MPCHHITDGRITANKTEKQNWKNETGIICLSPKFASYHASNRWADNTVKNSNAIIVFLLCTANVRQIILHGKHNLSTMIGFYVHNLLKWELDTLFACCKNVAKKG